MHSKVYIYKVFSVIPIVLFYKFNLLFQDVSDFYSLNALFSECIFDSKSIMENKLLILAINSIFLVVLFNLYFGIYIEKEFTTNGIFIFTRIKNRKKWFYNKYLELLCYSSLYTFLYMLSMLVICMISTRRWGNLGTIRIFVYLWVSLNFIIFISTLVINHLAIYYEEHVGFIMVYFAMLILIGISINFERIPFINHNYFYFYANPMSAMSLYTLTDSKLKIIVTLYYVLISYLLIIYLSNKASKLDISIDKKDRRG